MVDVLWVILHTLLQIAHLS